MAQSLRVTVIGKKATGKTSILVSLYQQWAKIIGETELQLIVDPTKINILDDQLAIMKALGEAVGYIEPIKGNERAYFYPFKIAKPNSKPSLQINFIDYPGGYLDDIKQQKFIIKALKSSSAVIVAINAPPLMEKNGKWNTKINCPEKILWFFQQAYVDLKHPVKDRKCVLLVPVKCELYMEGHGRKHEPCPRELYKQVCDEYTGLLKFLRCGDLSNKIACILMPVQTLGNVGFACLREEENNSEVVPKFVFKSWQKPYAPKDTDQIMRYLLRFLLKMHYDARRYGIINRIISIFRNDTALTTAIQKLALGCKETEGFGILQGRELLEINF